MPRRLVIIKAAQVFARDQRISLAVFLAVRFQNRPHRDAPFLQAAGEYFELEVFFLPAFLEVHRQLCGLRPPALGQLQAQHAVLIAGQVVGYADGNGRGRTVVRRDDLGSRLKHHRKCRHDGERTRVLFPGVVQEWRHHHGIDSIPGPYFARSAHHIFHARPQSRRRKGKRGVFFVIHMIHGFGFRIIAMPVRTRVLRIFRHSQQEVGMLILSSLDRLWAGLAADRVPARRNFQLDVINHQRKFRSVVKRNCDHKLLPR